MINKYIYVPEYKEGNCAIIYSSDVIRVYDSNPVVNSTISYRDYYPSLNYAYNIGSQRFSEYSTYPTCREVTTNVLYSQYVDRYLFIVLILIVSVMFLYNFLSHLFRR